MLGHILASLTTTIAPPLRALGYLDEALDMRQRARINRTAWQPHLERTRRSVLSAASACQGKDTVVVLGSGLLLDVPLPELAASFRRVVLKDVVCLPEVRKRLKTFSNATFVEHDVTGLADLLHRSGSMPGQALPDPPCTGPGAEHEADLVISLNILSQLWVVPRTFVRQHLRQHAPEEVDEWCGRIVANHYRFLRSLHGNVCLVADHTAVKRDRSGTIVSRSSTVQGLVLPEPDDHWTWNITPLGNKSPHTSKELLVGAWLFRAAPGDRGHE